MFTIIMFWELCTLLLKSLITDSSPMFAVVTSAKLALKAGVDSVSGVVYHRLNHAVLVSLIQYVILQIPFWISTNSHTRLVSKTQSMCKCCPNQNKIHVHVPSA